MSQTATLIRTKQILIVEDDKAIYTAMQVLLRHYEYDVTLATTLAEARRMLAEKPDFVLLDIQLPDGSGLDLLREMRADGNAARVVVATACNDPGVLFRAQSLKPDLMLKKPINFLDLLAKLKPVL